MQPLHGPNTTTDLQLDARRPDRSAAVLPLSPRRPTERARHAHPAGRAAGGRATEGPLARVIPLGTRAAVDEDGSLVTEYGLLAVVAATIASVVIAWASNGALVTLFNALLRHARSLVGA